MLLALADGAGFLQHEDRPATQRLDDAATEGCNAAQGFLFSRPVPATELASTSQFEKPPVAFVLWKRLRNIAALHSQVRSAI
ncbi:hypothetical protein [Bradyrhizobium sp. WSM1743]|uniref:hypothetical protein n=1 Tax=Bradyrhizobium sp. WSM1743 TaxID=318996 RepID=UPI0018DDFCB3|nr:hypothetical protein [Bradyrhizobium sp. WSM1743]